MDSSSVSLKDSNLLNDKILSEQNVQYSKSISKWSQMLNSQSDEDDNCDNNYWNSADSVSVKKSKGKLSKRKLKASRKSEDIESSWPSDDNLKPDSKKYKKKLEQYKDQIIKDQYGTFEYDKDPDGYKKARKRKQNRESALRARDKRVTKMVSVERTLTDIQYKSESLEKENLILKAEKKQLQNQVQNLLSIITSFGGSKRFKTSEMTEVKVDSVVNTNNKNEVTGSNSESTELLQDSKWSNLNCSDDNNQEMQAEFEPISLSPKGRNPEKTMLKLYRGENNEDSLFGQAENDNFYGDVFKKGLMFSLTIVMCMILWLTGFSVSNSIYDYNQKICSTCQVPRTPFEVRSTEIKTLMTHPDELHYEYNGVYEPVSSRQFIMHTWIGVFFVMVFAAFLFRKSIFPIYQPQR